MILLLTESNGRVTGSRLRKCAPGFWERVGDRGFTIYMKEKNKYSFLKANIVFLWEIMPSVWSVFFQNNMALTIFAICITGSVIGIIVCTSRYVMQKRKYSRSLTKRKRRLIQEAESDETKKIDLAIEIERETDKYQKTCKWYISFGPLRRLFFVRPPTRLPPIKR